jgi:hypothetical protein
MRPVVPGVDVLALVPGVAQGKDDQDDRHDVDAQHVPEHRDSHRCHRGSDDRSDDRADREAPVHQGHTLLLQGTLNGRALHVRTDRIGGLAEAEEPQADSGHEDRVQEGDPDREAEAADHHQGEGEPQSLLRTELHHDHAGGGNGQEGTDRLGQ